MKEKQRRNWIDCFVMNCISYTIVVVILAILSVIGIVQNMNERVMLQLFVCTTIISVITYIIKYMKGETGWKQAIIGTIQGMLVIIAVGGGMFHWFPWKWQYIVMVLSIFMVTYFISYAVQFADNRAATEKINKIIQEKRNESIE